jgi:uncharacterized membrane protein YhaH (DUF805 family)
MAPTNTDRILLPDKDELIWLFFRFNGRLGRAAFVLTAMFWVVVVSFPLYQFMRVSPDSTAAQAWSAVFGMTFIVFLWVHVASAVKRLHDMGKPGIMAVALFIPVVSIVAFIALCLFPGDAGRNRYGQFTNSAR